MMEGLEEEGEMRFYRIRKMASARALDTRTAQTWQPGERGIELGTRHPPSTTTLGTVGTRAPCGCKGTRNCTETQI